MLYLVALILPPLAILICGKPFQAVFNLLLILAGFLLFPLWILVPIHSLLVVSSRNADKRTDRIVKSMDRNG